LGSGQDLGQGVAGANFFDAPFLIGTTAEHPFWVKNKGWTLAGEIAAGDVLVGHDGQETVVEEVFDTGVLEKVYNLRVSEEHTYFVGTGEWGWSAWAHNAYFYHATDATKADSIVAGGPNLAIAKANRDFGKGFYTTTSEVQARTWDEAVVRFDVSDADLAGLNVHDFGLTVTPDWQTTVWRGRNGILDSDPLPYDMVRGLYLTNTGAVTQHAPSAWNLKGRRDQQTWLTAAAVTVLMTNRPEIVP
jgi:hypothetical protein